MFLVVLLVNRDSSFDDLESIQVIRSHTGYSVSSKTEYLLIITAFYVSTGCSADFAVND